jgi:hypothetical protein
MEFKCDRCGDDFKCKRNLIGHLQRNKDCTPNSDDAPLRQELLHKVTTRVVNEINFPCSLCDKRFNTMSAMYKHRQKCKDNNETSNIDNATIDEVKKVNINLLNDTNATVDELRKLNQYLIEENEKLKSNLVHVSFTIIGNGVVNERKYKKKPIPHSIKIKCWNYHIGELVPKTKCLCCNNVDITQHNFHCGHIIAESKGGSCDVNNLMPICNVCNYSMGSMNMNEFREMYGLSV